MTKHINCRVYDSRGNQKHARAHFVDDQLIAASGKQYRLGYFLGSGSNGTIFRCFDTANRELAVKFLHVLSERNIERFDFECQVLSSFDHLNILKLIDIGDAETTHEDSIPFMISELFDGNLQGLVEKEGPLDVKRIREFGIQTCDALSYAHSQGVIHRDIKPGNLFLKQDRVVVGDFGLAKTSTDEGQTRFHREDLTIASERVGPAEYMSPELARYASDKSTLVDHRSDIFQVAAVLLYLLTGQPPRGELDIEDDPTGGVLGALISQGRKQKPSRRYQSIDEMRLALLEVPF